MFKGAPVLDPVVLAVSNHLRGAGCRRVLVAFSGGMDSGVLAQAVHEVAATGDLQVGLGYFNHGLRGAESEREEAFCRELAQRRGWALGIGRWDAPRRGEAAAREARYGWLLETATAQGFEAVLTAHHQRDQTETLLLRLVRGSGPRALRAMAVQSKLGTGLSLLRPLLYLPREELEAFAIQRRLEWFEDSSNQSMEFLRNRIRKELLPLFEALRPGAESRLAGLAQRLREDYEGFDLLLQERLRGCLHMGPGWVVLRVAGLPAGRGILRRSVLEALQRLGVEEGCLVFGALDGLVQAAQYPGGAQRQFELGAGVLGLVVGQDLCFLKGAPWLPEPQGILEGLQPEDPRIAAILDLEVRFRSCKVGGPESGRLRIRTRRAGERLGPQARFLKELFIGRGLPRFLRARWPVFEDEFGPVWVPGIWRREGAEVPEIRFGGSWPWPLLPEELNR